MAYNVKLRSLDGRRVFDSIFHPVMFARAVEIAYLKNGCKMGVELASFVGQSRNERGPGSWFPIAIIDEIRLRKL